MKDQEFLFADTTVKYTKRMFKCISRIALFLCLIGASLQRSSSSGYVAVVLAILTMIYVPHSVVFFQRVFLKTPFLRWAAIGLFFAMIHPIAEIYGLGLISEKTQIDPREFSNTLFALRPLMTILAGFSALAVISFFMGIGCLIIFVIKREGYFLINSFWSNKLKTNQNEYWHLAIGYFGFLIVMVSLLVSLSSLIEIFSFTLIKNLEFFPDARYVQEVKRPIKVIQGEKIIVIEDGKFILLK